MTIGYPRQIGSLRLLERLGEGGMAHVFRAEDLLHKGRMLAIKFLKPEVLSDAGVVMRFLREGDLLKRLQHPHLATVYDMGKVPHGEGGRRVLLPYLVMELLAGGSLKDCRGEAPAKLVRRLLPVFEALIYVHQAGIIHRDLKPSNLLFGMGGQLKVTDFGVCLWESEEAVRFTKSQMVVGTLGYMAPEQHGDPRKVDARCDVYAMSAILYEFLTDHAYSQVQLPPSSVRPGFPPAMASLLMQGLAADPKRRIPSMIHFYDALQAWLDKAEAAGWGEEPLPGFQRMDSDYPTLHAMRSADIASVEDRLLPCLDALQTGGVGSRRVAAESLKRLAQPSDEAWLLSALSQAQDSAKFAIVLALAEVGGEAALERLLTLLEDPYVRAEAAEALSAVALRLGREKDALSHLRESGLGAVWRWVPRARLGDETWVQAVLEKWPSLSTQLRIQLLQAAQALPSELKEQVKQHTATDSRTGNLKEAWEAVR